MYVWVVEDNKVHKREVTVNAPTGEAQVLISKGLKPEEKIVIAGVYQLVEGENSKRYREMNLAKYSRQHEDYLFLSCCVAYRRDFFLRKAREERRCSLRHQVSGYHDPLSGSRAGRSGTSITEPISREIQSRVVCTRLNRNLCTGFPKSHLNCNRHYRQVPIPQKWDELRRKVLNIQPQLPSGASTPTVSDDFGDVFGIYYGLTADDGFSYDEMRNWAERIKTQVVTADGVMKVALFGVQTEVVNIFISTNKLVGMGIDPKQLASLLQSQNQIINTGEIRAGEQQLRVTANGMYTTIDDIRNQVITTKAGTG